MSARYAALLALTFIAASGCKTAPEVRADKDPTANLASYRTFGFFENLATEKSGYSTLLTNRLKAATQRELEHRGLQLDSSTPQLLVNFNVNIENRTDVQSAPTGAGFYGYRAGMYGPWAGYPQDVYTTHYQEGTLAIDLVDAAKRQLVWQGVAEGRVEKAAVEDPGAAVDKVVSAIFAKFPTGSSTAAP